MASIVPITSETKVTTMATPENKERVRFGLHFHNKHQNWLEKLMERYQDDKIMLQWCKLKQENMTDIIFVKKGKFYEVYHNDADVCYMQFHMPFMFGEDAHSGVPDVSFAGKSVYLQELGYTVQVLHGDE